MELRINQVSCTLTLPLMWYCHIHRGGGGEEKGQVFDPVDCNSTEMCVVLTIIRIIITKKQ